MAEPRKAGRDIRIGVFRALAILTFMLLTGQLWRLQNVQGEYYRQAADVNRYRVELDRAPRGVIYDQRGHLLVRNVPRLAVSIIPAYLPEDESERTSLLGRLAQLLDLPMSNPAISSPAGQELGTAQPGSQSTRGLLDILAQAEQAPYQPARVKTGVPRDVALQLEEEHLEWPGVLVEEEAARDYLFGATTAHLLGYVGSIPAEQAESYAADGYDPNVDLVGLTGLEYSFEQELRGQDGQRLVEVDVAGRAVDTVGTPREVVPGHSLVLTLDLGLQQETERILRQSLKALNRKQGAVIAMDPRTGEILALVSLPSYDDNLFTGGIGAEALKKLLDDPTRPLMNQAISGVYPPGSTFKMTVASAALEEGVATRDTRLGCGGILWLPNRYYPEDPSLAQPFYCWIYTQMRGQHGYEDIVTAISHSCDIFFYQLGGGYRGFEGLGVDRMGYYAQLFGLGARTGIDLPGEASGLAPSPRWKRLNYSESWSTGDTYNMAIGQGYVLATPLQILNVASAVANGGTLYRPQLVHEILDGEGKVVRPFAPDVIRTVPVSPENLSIVREGMRAAVAGAGGTAWTLRVPGVAVAAKTGTAEFFEDKNKDGLPDRDREGNLPTHAWAVAFAPFEDPEIVVVAFVYGGGQGSSVSIPIINEVLDYYFAQEREEGEP